MYNITLNNAELKLELFRIIDTLPLNRLQQFYQLLTSNSQNQDNSDLWDSLSEWEKQDIEIGIEQLNSGKYKDMKNVLLKY